VIPTWFRSTSYEGASSFSALEWYKHLSIRRYFAEHIFRAEDGSDGDDCYTEVHEPTLNAIATLRRNPIDFTGAMNEYPPDEQPVFGADYSTAGLRELNRKAQCTR
jgi:hypothetical protein